jgi:hypothetical protein
LNFILSCGAVLQRYDYEREKERREFDLERDRMQRKFIAAMLGVKLPDSSSGPSEQASSGQKQTQTARDLMRNYKQEHG